MGTVPTAGGTVRDLCWVVACFRRTFLVLMRRVSLLARTTCLVIWGCRAAVCENLRPGTAGCSAQTDRQGEDLT